MSKIGRGHNNYAFLLEGFFGLSIFAVAAACVAGLPAQPPNRAVPTVSAAARLSDSFADVAKSVEPAVVSIDAKTKTPDPNARGRTTPGESHDIMEFFRRQLPRRPIYSVGSGF